MLRELGRPALWSLAQALEARRLEPPFPAVQLRNHVPEALMGPVGATLQEMVADGMAPRHIARLLRFLAEEREAAQGIADRVELVWSGLDLEAATTRDTEVVVHQLFRQAQRTILVASFAVDRDQKAHALFGDLADRMDAEPDLDVRFFLNVQRQRHDDRAESILLREFADSFRDRVWPGTRLPDLFHDPRSLAVGGPTRACLHAKCIVVDDELAFLTSANFTEAAQLRNIEAGLLVDDRQVARSLRAQFETLVERGALRRVPGL